jgi:hypothetical protein
VKPMRAPRCLGSAAMVSSVSAARGTADRRPPPCSGRRWSDLGRQGEDQVEVPDRQQIGLAGGEPILRRRALALGAMPVAARVVGDPAVAAVLAALDMTAEDGRAAVLDRRHHLELAEAHMPGMSSAPGGAVVMEDVRDLQLRAAHRPPARRRVSILRSAAIRAGRAG